MTHGLVCALLFVLAVNADNCAKCNLPGLAGCKCDEHCNCRGTVPPKMDLHMSEGCADVQQSLAPDNTD